MSINSKLKDQLRPLSKNLPTPSAPPVFPLEPVTNGRGGGTLRLKSPSEGGLERAKSQESAERSGEEAATTFGASVPPTPSSRTSLPGSVESTQERSQEQLGETGGQGKEEKAGGQAEERLKGAEKEDGRKTARAERQHPQGQLAMQRLFHKLGEQDLPEISGYQRYLQASSFRWQEKMRQHLPTLEARWQGRLKELLSLRKDFLGLEEACGWLGGEEGQKEETSRLRREIEHDLSHVLSTLQTLQEMKEALASSNLPIEGSFGSAEGLVFEDASAPTSSLTQTEIPTVSVDLAWPSNLSPTKTVERPASFGERPPLAAVESAAVVFEPALAGEEATLAVEEAASVAAGKEEVPAEASKGEAGSPMAFVAEVERGTAEFHPAEVTLFQAIEQPAEAVVEKFPKISPPSQGEAKGSGKAGVGREPVSFEKTARGIGNKEGVGEKQGHGREAEERNLSLAGGQTYQQEGLKASLGERDRGIFEELLYHLHDPGDTLRYLNHASEEEQFLRLSIWGAKARWLQERLNGGLGEHPSVRTLFGILLNKKRDLKCRWIEPLDRKFEAIWPHYILEKEKELQELKESIRRGLERDMEELEKARVRKVRFFEKVDRLKGLVIGLSPALGEGEAKAKEFLGLLLEIVEASETGGDLANLDLLMTIRPYEGWFEKGREFRGLRKHLRNLQERAKRHEEVRRASLTELPAAEPTSGGEEEGETLQDELLSRVLEHVAGLPALIVGGNEREEKRLRLEKRLQLSSLEWIPSENGRPRACGTAIERIEKGQVKLLLILLSFCGHVKVNQMITAAKKAGILWVPIAHGHGESRVLHSIAYYLGLLKDAPKGTVWE